MKRHIYHLLIVISLGTGCATTYQGTGPNLNAIGKDSVEEFHKYKMKESDGRFSVVMGKDYTEYSARSVMPFIQRVSPGGYESFERANIWRQAQETTLLVSIASFAAYLLNTKNSSLGYLSVGSAMASIGLSFSWGGSFKEGIRIYNGDLESKLRANYNSNPSQ